MATINRAASFALPRLDEVVEAMLRTGLKAEDQKGRALRASLEGERASARAQIAPALAARWWDNAKVEFIVRVHDTAQRGSVRTRWRALRRRPSGGRPNVSKNGGESAHP